MPYFRTLEAWRTACLGAPPVLDTTLVLGVALLLGGLTPLATLPCVAAGAGMLLVAKKKLRLWQQALFIMAFGLGVARAAWTLNDYDSRREIVLAVLTPPDRCAGLVRVVSSPTKMGDRYSFIASARSLECSRGQTVPSGALLRLYAPNGGLARHDEIAVVVSLGVVEIARNPGVDAAQAMAARSGVVASGGVLDAQMADRSRWSWTAWVDRARHASRQRIEETYPPQAIPLARALVLGENDLPPDDAEAFRVSGLSHLLAVSGTHIVIAVLGLVALLEGFLRRIPALVGRFEVGRIAAGAGIPLTWVYAEFAGAGGSVRRAALMTTVALLARVLGRAPHGMRALGLSVLAGALIDPLAAYDLSFGLSAGATTGLMVLSRPLQQRMVATHKLLGFVAAPVAATLSATTLCLPWLMMVSTHISLAGVVLNVVAVPIGEAISLPVCLGHLLLGFWPDAQRGMALLGGGSLLAVRALARFGLACDWLAIPVPRPTAWQLAIGAVFATALAVRGRRERRLSLMLVGAAALLAAECSAIHWAQPRGKLRITFFDVGQGDSMLVAFPNGQSMLIDGGGAVGSPVDPGIRILQPILRAQRRSRVNVLVLTHPHPDHLIGLASIAERVEARELWDNGHGLTQQAGPIYAQLLQTTRRKQMHIRRPPSLCNRRWAFGSAHVRVLGPCPDLDRSANFNNNSLVLQISMGRHRALLVGDAEHEQEQSLLQAGYPVRADILKVGHHGSRSSTSAAFLAAVRPSDAVVSCGVRNRFGHPTPETITTLRWQGVRVWRTDQHGGLVWETDGVSQRLSATK